MSLSDIEQRLAQLKEVNRIRAVEAEMTGLKFRSANCAKQFAELVAYKVESLPNGYYGPNYENLGDYVQQRYQVSVAYHPDQQEQTSPAAPSRIEPPFDLDDISPKMTAEQEKQAWAAMRRAVEKR